MGQTPVAKPVFLQLKHSVNNNKNNEKKNNNNNNNNNQGRVVQSPVKLTSD